MYDYYLVIIKSDPQWIVFIYPMQGGRKSCIRKGWKLWWKWKCWLPDKIGKVMRCSTILQCLLSAGSLRTKSPNDKLISPFFFFFFSSKLPREQGSILYCTTGVLLRWLVSDPWVRNDYCNNVHEKIMHFWFAEKECILL